VTEGSPVHEYPPRLLHSPWLRGLYTLSALFAAFAVATGHGRAAVGPVLGPLAAVALPGWRRLRLRLSDEGISVNVLSVSWSGLAAIDRRGIGPAAQDVFVLREPLEYPKWLTFGNKPTRCR
jgi:hypothetical protein